MPESNIFIQVSDARGRDLVIGKRKKKWATYVFYRYKDMDESDKKAVKAVFNLVSSEEFAVKTGNDAEIKNIDDFLDFKDGKPKLCG